MRPRLRRTTIIALGLLPVILATPTSAHATDGEFSYRVGLTPYTLTDPESGECINLTGTTEQRPARAFRNRTISTATVFENADCEGAWRSLRPIIGLDLLFAGRSVVFS
ncbi:hypothetical protein ACFWP3_41400 [Streptomyces sp. NPDC058525]|uniref:hypothetical protein n=1 Tax=Streptomyces sp. NPDC058525 TaxID=3346538 RepID=UPI00365100AA